MWGTFLVLAIALGLAFAFWPDTTERHIRIAGWALEFFGLLTVVDGIRRTRHQFGQESPVTIVAKWWQRRKPRTVYGHVSERLGGLEAKAEATSLFATPPTLEQRVAELEKNLKNLTERVANDAANLAKEVAGREQAIAREKQAREHADVEIKETVRSFATGGIYVSLMGLVWLLFGMSLATLPQEILDCASVMSRM